MFHQCRLIHNGIVREFFFREGESRKEIRAALETYDYGAGTWEIKFPDHDDDYWENGFNISAKEKALAIKEELKVLGYTDKAISIKSRPFAFSEALVDITIKDLSISAEKIEELANRYKRIKHDEFSGEMLANENCYVNVNYDSEAIILARETALYRALAGELEELVKKLKQGYWLGLRTDNFEISLDGLDSYKVWINNEPQIAHNTTQEVLDLAYLYFVQNNEN